MIKRGRTVSKSDSSQPSSQENNRNSKEINANLKFLNISVCNKIPILRQLIDSQHPDIIIGSETWLSSTVSNNEIIPSDLHGLCNLQERSK